MSVKISKVVFFEIRLLKIEYILYSNILDSIYNIQDLGVYHSTDHFFFEFDSIVVEEESILYLMPKIYFQI